MTEDELNLYLDSEKARKRAYLLWHQFYLGQQADEDIEPFLDKKITIQGPWLNKVRKALFYSSNEIARRMKTSHQNYLKLEQAEGSGTISLNSLRKAAEALDCELVYAIRPKEKVRYSEIIWPKF